ncbi:hypothetical protein EYF80_053089 [Liparis tanakae]|uniref:Uncharacterized protein n=1 Tax=Liparis tanakae TaxID=230148 RepID=A0A4Z2F8X0_9TELE|nr:hypothetical protein EYF80_053089 [Liparis tanakae]
MTTACNTETYHTEPRRGERDVETRGTRCAPELRLSGGPSAGASSKEEKKKGAIHTLSSRRRPAPPALGRRRHAAFVAPPRPRLLFGARAVDSHLASALFGGGGGGVPLSVVGGHGGAVGALDGGGGGGEVVGGGAGLRGGPGGRGRGRTVDLVALGVALRRGARVHAVGVALGGGLRRPPALPGGLDEVLQGDGAELADVRPLAGVQLAVALQRALPGEVFAAVVAAEGLEAAVRPHVDLHVPEDATADAARPAGVPVALDVKPETLGGLGLLSADAAAARGVVRVSLCVPHKVALVVKGVAADPAAVRRRRARLPAPPPGRGLGALAAFAEALPADVAAERRLSGVDFRSRCVWWCRRSPSPDSRRSPQTPQTHAASARCVSACFSRKPLLANGFPQTRQQWGGGARASSSLPAPRTGASGRRSGPEEVPGRGSLSGSSGPGGPSGEPDSEGKRSNTLKPRLQFRLKTRTSSY